MGPIGGKARWKAILPPNPPRETPKNRPQNWGILEKPGKYSGEGTLLTLKPFSKEGPRTLYFGPNHFKTGAFFEKKTPGREIWGLPLRDPRGKVKTQNSPKPNFREKFFENFLKNWGAEILWGNRMGAKRLPFSRGEYPHTRL